MSKMDNFVKGCCQLVELGCLVAIAGIAFERNKAAYNASKKCIDAEFKLIAAEVERDGKELEIQRLKRKIDELENEENAQA